MLKTILTTLIAIMVLSAVVFVNNSAVAQENTKGGRAIDETKRIELRIDRLTMVLADKAEEGMDTSKAEDLLVDAIDLFDSGKLDEAMNKMDEVERALGLEPMRFNRRDGENQGDRPFENRFGIEDREPNAPFFEKELSKEDKNKMFAEIKKNLSEAQKLIDSGKYEEAFKIIGQAHRMLGHAVGIKPPRPDQMGPGGPGGGPNMGSGRGPQDGQGPGMGQGMRPQDGSGMEIMFQKAKEKGPEGFDKLAEFFTRITSKMDEKGVEYNRESVKHFDEAVKLRKSENLEKAFDKIHLAFKMIHESVRDKMGQPGFNNRLNQKQSMGKKKMDPDTAREVKELLTKLKNTADKYIEKHGQDDFIKTCYKDFQSIERKFMNGDISKEEAANMVKKLQKKVEENM